MFVGSFLRRVVIFGIITASGHAADPDALIRQADRFADAGDLLRARPFFAEAEQEFRSRGDERNALYAKFGRLKRDVETGSYTAVENDLRKDLANPVVQSDPHLKIRALSVKGSIDLNLNSAAAKDDFRQILALAKQIDDKKWQNRAEGELGVIAGLNGNTAAAGLALLKAMQSAAMLKDMAAQITFTTWLANGMTVNGMSDRAIPMLDRTIDLVRANPDSGFPAELYIAKVRALVQPPAGADPKNQAAAQQILSEALDSATRNSILGAQAELLNMAAVLAAGAHHFEQAENFLKQAGAAAAAANLPRMKADAELQLAMLYQSEGRNENASSAIDSGIAELQKVEEPFDLPQYIARKADIQADLGRVHIADQLYTQSTQMLEGLLINAPSSQVKSSLLATMSDAYVGHFRLAIDRFHSPEMAFRIIEAARGRTVADSIRAAAVRTNDDERSPAEVQIVTLQRQLRDSTNSPAQTKRLLDRLDQAYDNLAPAEYAHDRAEMRMRHTAPAALASIQKRLAPDQAIVEYVLDRHTNSYALEITSGDIKVHRLPARGEIDKLVSQYVRAIRTQKDWRPVSRTLFDAVVKPTVTGSPASIVFVPDGSLHLVPFASLLNAENKPLIEATAVSTAPSATVLQILKTARGANRASKVFLGVAYSPKTKATPATGYPASTRGIFDLAGPDLKPLMFAAQEVKEVAQVAGRSSSVLLDAAATETALKSEPLGDYRILHFAVHGISYPADPERSALVLAPDAKDGDGLWQPREIRDSRLNADLVTLSACETGTGRLQGEEGVMNLARIFLMAGAKSVVASLWDVEDRSTATLMVHFYRQLAQGKSVAEALRSAQLEMLSTFGNDYQPFYWAGFTVIGDGERKIPFGQTTTSESTAARRDLR